MAIISVEAEAALLDRACEVTGEQSNRAVVHLALRRLIAEKQKEQMVDGIAELTELPRGLNEPVVPPCPKR